MTRLPIHHYCACALLGLILAVPARAQSRNGVDHEDNPLAVRKVDPHAPCRFAAEYKRIQANKSDPRVAFMELNALVHNQFDGFRDPCKIISNQTEEITSFFDPARGYLQAIGGESSVNEALAYFSHSDKKSGIVLYVKRSFEESRSFVFTHVNGSWRDVTANYLGPLPLAKDDYIVVPQYGRTARILTFDAADSQLHHKLWIRWDGTRFQPTSVAPSDWRCPDVYGKRRMFPEEEILAVCSTK